MKLRWILLDLAFAAGTFVYGTSVAAYPWQLALLTAMAVGALSYAARRTLTNLRELHRPPEERWERVPDAALPDDGLPEDDPDPSPR